MKCEPAQFTQAGGIDQPEKGLAATKGLRQLISWDLLQSVQPLSKPQSEQRLSLTAVSIKGPAGS